jgi:hypothetical protein
MTYDPPDLISQAARVENWDERDWRHFHKIESEAMIESFEVTQIAGNHLGLIAYDSPYARFISAAFPSGAAKPTLRAFEILSTMLLRAKVQAKAA